LKVLTIVGARPQFIKAAPVSHALREHHGEFLLHTGQHYDADMSDVFFKELNIPAPNVNLGVGSGGHGTQTGAMLAGIEQHLLEQNPDWILLYGDTNSTLAGALAASKLHIKVAHIEAGLRSFNRTMPEEINRVLTDHVSDLLFCPTQTAVENLTQEGITKGVHHVGDVMVDALYYAKTQIGKRAILTEHGLANADFYLATIHRPANTDHYEHLSGIIEGFKQLATSIVLPMHPRLKASLEREGLSMPPNVKVIPPVGYLDMATLLDAAQIVITDSGGLQKETYVMQRPCVTIRPETEWIETVHAGWNRLCEPNPGAIQMAVQDALKPPPTDHPTFYGDGTAAQQIVNIMAQAHG